MKLFVLMCLGFCSASLALAGGSGGSQCVLEVPPERIKISTLRPGITHQNPVVKMVLVSCENQNQVVRIYLDRVIPVSNDTPSNMIASALYAFSKGDLAFAQKGRGFLHSHNGGKGVVRFELFGDSILALNNRKTVTGQFFTHIFEDGTFAISLID
jgi:hypothetical protein